MIYAITNQRSSWCNKENFKIYCKDIRVWVVLFHVNEFRLTGFTDSDWAGSLEDRKSTSGLIFNLGSAAITWSSKKQEIIALSSIEAEFIAATSAACREIWLRRLLLSIDEEQSDPTVLFCDNRSTIALAKNPILHGRTKHIDLRFHFI